MPYEEGVRITLAYVLTCVFVLTGVLALAAPMRAIAEETSAQGPAATTTVDPDTRDRWKHWAAGGGDESRLSTQNVGRIWTDKTVEAAGDEDQSNFLTTLSVMSSTSNTTVPQSMPLDIVLVLDVSGSMDDPMGSTDSTKRIDALKLRPGPSSTPSQSRTRAFRPRNSTRSPSSSSRVTRTMGSETASTATGGTRITTRRS